MINRLILWLALVGMVLALHLWIQKARGFDQGCLGMAKPTEIVSGDCLEVGELPASHLFGISNAAWGYAFYFSLALLSFSKILAPAEWARRFHLLGELGVLLALFYSGYLVFQMLFVAKAVCVLCLSSAILISVLAGLHGLLRFRGGYQPPAPDARLMELGLSIGGLFAASGVLVGVLLFVNRLGTRPLNQGSSFQELQEGVGQALPMYIDQAKLTAMRACRMDRAAPPLDLSKVVTAETPFIGAPDGVTVVVFYDPNCGHCRRHYPEFKALVEREKARAKFYVLPRRLWAQSELQVASLQLAAKEGKYFQLWDAYFGPAFVGKDGLSLKQIEEIFRSLELNTVDLAQRLKAQKPAGDALLSYLRTAEVNGTPAVFIDGTRVSSYNHGPECIEKLVTQWRDTTTSGEPHAARAGRERQ